MKIFPRSRVLRGFGFAVSAFVLLAIATASHAEPNDGSGYFPQRGAPFFVLTDTQFGSSDDALLRVELSPHEDALEAAKRYGGLEVRVYRVPEPLGFLKAQKNLRRVDVTARPRPEGAANLLAYLWSNHWNKARRAWRGIFSSEARRAVITTAPILETRAVKPNYQPVTRFAPLKGFDLVSSFRYPVFAARPIAPPEVNLQGSSSNWIPQNSGNFHVPLGKLAPGLYLAEAILGAHRATTLVFVSDTVAITKMASGSLTAWTANRTDGRVSANAKLVWTDGRGTLASAQTDARGLATLEHASPERTYLLGEDAAGGVFVSENFYYDSEIYDTKLYAVSDRPLYRPGDWVSLKFFAREYRAANLSFPAEAGEITVRVLDPNGTPVLSTHLSLRSDTGTDTGFRLPDGALAGGYEIRVRQGEKQYSAAFRVAEYVKPHFEITLVPAHPGFKTGEEISGLVRLTYPDGKPVKNAGVELTLRAQTLTMVQGELRYSGLFPVELSAKLLTTDDKGEAPFVLPPAKEPSRLIFSMLATDGAAYRVKSTRELLVERAAASWRLEAENRFSLPGEAARFQLAPENAAAAPILPVSWEITRLESQTKTQGTFDAGVFDSQTPVWTPKLELPGSYSLTLRDAAGNIVGAAAHWVGGGDGRDGVKAIPGTLELVTDKERYQPGDVAQVLMTFSEPVDEALLTLERDAVEAAALMSASAAGRGAGWVSVEKLAPNQWRAKIPVQEIHAPNLTFSAVYVKHGEYVFQNAGIVVETPRIAVTVKTDKAEYQPGETVTVDLAASLKGRPVEAMLTVSVVDEMIYALQPEIAPDIVEFFQHIRRNNIRTSASLSFITYDEAVDYSADAAMQPPARHQYNERGIKVLERARRDETDTAAWQPALLTDAAGSARFSFRMPDSLTRWRITVRATAQPAAGGKAFFGQRMAWLTSNKNLYAKWTSPNWLRADDAPVARIAVFNNTDAPREAEATLSLAGKILTQKATFERGISYLSFDLPGFSGRQTARLEIRENGEAADALETVLVSEPSRWRSVAERILPVSANGEISLPPLPADTGNLTLSIMEGGSTRFLRVADSLIEYPWGCVEQTSSRLIPLALAVPLLAPEHAARGHEGRLWQMLYGERLRLSSLAGPGAVFGWWGTGTSKSAFLSAYAYYADWLAARALGLEIPDGHWEHILDIYSRHADKEPLLYRALALWFIQQIGLPVETQLRGLAAALPGETAGRADTSPPSAPSVESPLMNAPESAFGLAYARVLTAALAKENGLKPSAAFTAALPAAETMLAQSSLPSAQALLLLAGTPDAAGASRQSGKADAILDAASEAVPTLDRALTLVWLQKALGGVPGASASQEDYAPAEAEDTEDVEGQWQPVGTPSGRGMWRWTGTTPVPAALRVTKPDGSPALPSIMVRLRYETDEAAAETALPVTLERRLFRLERRALREGRGLYVAEEVEPGEALSTHELYLDEISLSSREGEHNYGFVEVPMPPGANVERGTWGVRLLDDGEQIPDSQLGGMPLDASRAEEKRDRYGVPVERLSPGEDVLIRHLLRFSQTGRFVLPPARYVRMYQPEQKAYAADGNTEWKVE